jgi:hypothetical protein
MRSATEMTVGIVCCCIPIVFVLFKGASDSLREAWSSLQQYGRSRSKGVTNPEAQSTEDIVEASFPKFPSASMTGVTSFIRRVHHTKQERAEPYNELQSFDADYHLQLQRMETGSRGHM